MPMMRSLAPIRVASLTGHIVTVLPEGSYVPDEIVGEAEYRGCVVIDEGGSKPKPEAKPEPETKPESPIPSDRAAAIVKATRELLRKGADADFRTDGVPRIGALREHMGDDTVTNRELAYALATVTV
jgi:hypothetical protein